jgi:hypothetical protein
MRLMLFYFTNVCRYEITRTLFYSFFFILSLGCHILHELKPGRFQSFLKRAKVKVVLNTNNSRPAHPTWLERKTACSCRCNVSTVVPYLGPEVTAMGVCPRLQKRAAHLCVSALLSNLAKQKLCRTAVKKDLVDTDRSMDAWMVVMNAWT